MDTAGPRSLARSTGEGSAAGTFDSRPAPTLPSLPTSDLTPFVPANDFVGTKSEASRRVMPLRSSTLSSSVRLTLRYLSLTGLPILVDRFEEPQSEIRREQ